MQQKGKAEGEMLRSAVCCCGRGRIVVAGEPVLNGICHCDDCRRRTGSAFGWSAYFRDDQVRDVTGPTQVYEVSGTNPQHRHFCVVCGSTLYWKAAAFAGMTGIAGGCFVESPLPAPALSLRTAGKCVWVGLPPHWDQRD
jgi:hypothetical protein